jgi:hypothetical protein
MTNATAPLTRRVLGALINNLWTLADEGGSPEVNQFTLQLFINHNFSKGWAVAFSPIITANCDAPSGEEWTVPLGAESPRQPHSIAGPSA